MCASPPPDAGPEDAPTADAHADAPTEAACRHRVCGVDVLCGVEDDGCGGTVSCGTCWNRARSLRQLARGLVADTRRQLLYASVPGDAPTYPNTIVTVDPTTMKITRSIDIGSNPSVMALADDGNTLWVGLDGALSIRRVDLSSDPPQVGPLMPLPADVFGTRYFATMILCLPGMPRTVVVGSRLSSPYQAVDVLDDGVVRPMRLDWSQGTANMVVGPSGTLLGTDSSDLVVATVSATGLATTDIRGLGEGGSLTYAPGRLYSSNGGVFDVSNLALPTRIGRFAFTGIVFPEAGKAQAIMFSPPSFATNAALMMRLVDTDKITEIRPVPISNVAASYHRSPVRLGADRFAFLAVSDDYSTSPSRQLVSIVVFDTDVAHPRPDGGL